MGISVHARREMPVTSKTRNISRRTGEQSTTAGQWRGRKESVCVHVCVCMCMCVSGILSGWCLTPNAAIYLEVTKFSAIR